MTGISTLQGPIDAVNIREKYLQEKRYLIRHSNTIVYASKWLDSSIFNVKAKRVKICMHALIVSDGCRLVKMFSALFHENIYEN